MWKPTDDIEKAYTDAREVTMKLIPLVSCMRLTSGEEPPLEDFLGVPPADFEEDQEDMSPSKGEFEIISEAKQVDMEIRFKRMADAVYVEAKRSTISSVAQVPLYFYGLLLALGWNEIWAVLRSPVYFIFLLLCCALGYVVYTLNLWGPIIQVSNAMSQQALDIGKVCIPTLHFHPYMLTGAPNRNASVTSSTSRATATWPLRGATTGQGATTRTLVPSV